MSVRTVITVSAGRRRVKYAPFFCRKDGTWGIQRWVPTAHGHRDDENFAKEYGYASKGCALARCRDLRNR